MHLHSVRLSGFKSFLRDAEVSFVNGFNCISGPNGSGKSNVLDGIVCALTSDISKLRCATLKDLITKTNLAKEAKDPTYVNLVFLNKDKQGSKLTEDQYEISMTISPQGESRSYRLNGKNKSQKEIRDFLKAGGLNIEEPSFILQQNSIASVAVRDPQKLAQAVISAAGTSSFHENVEQARNELQRVHENERSTVSNIEALEASIGEEREKLAAQGKLQELEIQIDTAQKRLVCQEYDESSAAAAELEAQLLQEAKRKTQIEMNLQTESATLEQLEQQVQEEARLAKSIKVSKIDPLEKKLRSVSTELVVQEEELNQERKSFEDEKRDKVQAGAIVAAKTLEASRQKCRQENMSSELKALISQRARMEETLREEAESMQPLNLEDDPEKLIKARVKSLSEKSRQTSGKRDALKTVAEQISRSKAAMEQGLHQLKESEESLLNSARSAENSLQSLRASRPAQMPQDRLADLLSESSKLTEQRLILEHSIRQLERQLGHSNESGGKVAGDRGTLLSLLKVRPEAEKLLYALNIIGGKSFTCRVVDDSSAAERILQAAEGTRSGLRLWPLDRLLVNDTSKAQRNVLGMYGKSRVTLPLDVVAFDQSNLMAVQRCFGSWVVVSNDSLAREIALGHDLPCITVDGVQHRKGTLIGGYRAPSANLLELKFQLQRAQEDLSNISLRVDEVHAKIFAVQELEESNRSLEQAITQAQHSLEKATRDLERLRTKKLSDEVRLSELASQLSQTQRDCADAEALLSATEKELRSLLQSAARGNKLESLLAASRSSQRSLKDQLTSLTKREVKLEAELEDSKSAWADVVAEVERQQDYLESFRDQESVQGMIEKKREAVERLRQNADCVKKELESARHELEKQSTSNRAERPDKDSLESTVAALKKELNHLNKDIVVIEKSLSERRSTRASLESTHEFLRGRDDAPKQALLSDSEKAELAYRIKGWDKQRAELRKRDTKITEQGVVQAKDDQLNSFKSALDTIKVGIKQLDEGIQSTLSMVFKANEAMFATVSSKLSQYFHKLAPLKEAELRKVSTKGHVEEGVEFWIRSSDDGKQGQWKKDLLELSGGQRTLLSLSFLFALSSGRRSLLYIMDEIDAALDEENVSAVAKLVRDVFAESQVLCVSHHHGFQIQAQRTIEISRHAEQGSVVLRLIDRPPVDKAETSKRPRL